jgi:acyl-CoA reductase-like NAD-dependent aldehyde dehydrogenase
MAAFTAKDTLRGPHRTRAIGDAAAGASPGAMDVVGPADREFIERVMPKRDIRREITAARRAFETLDKSTPTDHQQ